LEVEKKGPCLIWALLLGKKGSSVKKKKSSNGTHTGDRLGKDERILSVGDKAAARRERTDHTCIVDFFDKGKNSKERVTNKGPVSDSKTKERQGKCHEKAASCV